jgi:uncharacterized protein with HEPN domain
MQPEARDAAYLWDIIQAARDISDFVSDLTYEQFAADKKTRYAVERQLLAIGEAANRVSALFRNEHPEIPWRRIVAQRNVLAHEYGELLVERIWLVVKESIPQLVETLQRLLPQDQ